MSKLKKITKMLQDEGYDVFITENELRAVKPSQTITINYDPISWVVDSTDNTEDHGHPV